MLSDLTRPANGAAEFLKRPSERRDHARFPMQLDVILRCPALHGDWITARTHDLSASGAFLESLVPLPCHSALEYVVTLPSELTRASRPLRVRFYGSVIRVGHPGNGVFTIAVRNTNYRYLSHEESEAMSSTEQSLNRNSG